MRIASVIAVVAAGLGTAVAAPADVNDASKPAPADTNNAQAKPEFFLIRHAEKNPDGTISATGMQRAQCLINVFGRNSKYNIQHIMVQTPYPGDNLSQRPFNTTLPLADSLGITMDTPCDFDDPQCAADFALQYRGGNVLIGWEHGELRKVSQALGGSHVPKYPGDRFDEIYNQPAPYSKITVTSEDCPGIDD